MRIESGMILRISTALAAVLVFAFVLQSLGFLRQQGGDGGTLSTGTDEHEASDAASKFILPVGREAIIRVRLHVDSACEEGVCTSVAHAFSHLRPHLIIPQRDIVEQLRVLRSKPTVPTGSHGQGSKRSKKTKKSKSSKRMEKQAKSKKGARSKKGDFSFDSQDHESNDEEYESGDEYESGGEYEGGGEYENGDDRDEFDFSDCGTYSNDW